MNKMVVIVEDEPIVRDLVAGELEENGYAVMEFDSADAALPYLRLHGGEAALVVTDVQMPGSLNGLQLTDIICQICPGVPVLITSGGALVNPAALPSCAVFLRKPWRPSEMLARVRTLAGEPARH